MASSRSRTLLLMNCLSLSSNHVLTNVLRNVQTLKYSKECNKQLMEIHMKAVAEQNDHYLYAKEKLNEINKLSRQLGNRLKNVKKVFAKSSSYVLKAVKSLEESIKLCRHNSRYLQDENQCMSKLDSYHDHIKRHVIVDADIVFDTSFTYVIIHGNFFRV